MNYPFRLGAHFRDFVLARKKPQVPPFRLWVDISSRCNLTCVACPQRMLSQSQRRDMDPVLLEKLVAQIPLLTPIEVNLFHRGEPLMHPQLGQWIKRFVKAGAMVRIHTNATLLNSQKAAELVLAGPKIITCSVDSLEPLSYALARPPADLDKTLKGVERLLDAKKLVKGPAPKISLLLMGEHPFGPKEQAKLERLKNKGLDRMIRRMPHNWGGSLGKLGKSESLHKCTFPWYGLAVLSDGCVTACPQDFFGQIPLGWAWEESLIDIWRGPKAVNLRQSHAKRDFREYPICTECDRIRRTTFLGVPTEHLKNFMAESIVSKLGRNLPKK